MVSSEATLGLHRHGLSVPRPRSQQLPKVTLELPGVGVAKKKSHFFWKRAPDYSVEYMTLQYQLSLGMAISTLSHVKCFLKSGH